MTAKPATNTKLSKTFRRLLGRSPRQFQLAQGSLIKK